MPAAIATCWRSAARTSTREPVQAGGTEGADRPKTPQQREPQAGKRRLSFHEKHALETLPKTIAALQAKVRALHDRLDDPAFYARDRKAFDETSAALAAAQAELAAAEEKWLELEMLREELEGG